MKISTSSILPIMSMVFLPFSAIIGSASAALYMGVPLDPVVLITAWTIVFGIYGLNRFTDVEDMINNPEKRVFYKNKPWLLLIIISVLGLSVLLLIITMKFTAFHLLIILTGIAYSVKLIPVIEKNGTIRFTRLKDISFAKSFCVAIIWGTYFFAIPLALYPQIHGNLFEIMLFIISFTLAVFVNTNFLDIIDLSGDKISGIPTIPARFGVRNTLVYAIGVPSFIWISVVISILMAGSISGLVAIILLVNGLFPALYIYGYFSKVIPQKIIDLAADSCSYVFSAGILFLYFVRNQIF